MKSVEVEKNRATSRGAYFLCFISWQNRPRKPLRFTRNNGVWENPNLVKAREEEKQRGERETERENQLTN
jgi:hypothetical protein